MADRRTTARYCASFRVRCAATPECLIAIPDPFGSSDDPPDRCAHDRAHHMARLIRSDHCATLSSNWDRWDH